MKVHTQIIGNYYLVGTVSSHVIFYCILFQDEMAWHIEWRAHPPHRRKHPSTSVLELARGPWFRVRHRIVVTLVPHLCT